MEGIQSVAVLMKSKRTKFKVRADGKMRKRAFGVRARRRLMRGEGLLQAWIATLRSLLNDHSLDDHALTSSHWTNLFLTTADDGDGPSTVKHSL